MKRGSSRPGEGREEADLVDDGGEVGAVRYASLVGKRKVWDRAWR